MLPKGEAYDGVEQALDMGLSTNPKTVQSRRWYHDNKKRAIGHINKFRLKMRDTEEWRKKRSAYNLKYSTANPEARRASAKKWCVNNPEKATAHKIVHNALRTGRLKRPTACTQCGIVPLPARDGRSGLHAHHEDYSKPLDVTWLCSFCHAKERRRHL